MSFRLFSLSLVATLAALPAASLTMKQGSKWPSLDIPVCWEAYEREHAQERDLIKKSIAWTWSKESAVRFTGWRKCKNGSPGVRIAIETKFPQTRGRGKELDGQPAGMILPSLWSLAALSVNLKAPVHEFGHVLGFGHEYARSDTPDPERCSAKGEDGAPYRETDQHLTPFDIDSIMVGCIVGATRKFSLGTPMLSASDIFGLVGVYGSHPDNVLDADEPGDQFGAALLLEDLDVDGTPDLAVAAPGEDSVDGGAIYLFKGDTHRGFRPWRRVDPQSREFPSLSERLQQQAGSEITTPVTARNDAVAAPPASHRFPDLTDVAANGLVIINADLNNDGIVDRIIGAPNSNGATGAVIVQRGSAPNSEGAVLTNWYWFGQSY